MPLPSITRVIRIPATLLVAGAAMLAPAAAAHATDPSLIVVVTADGAGFDTTVEISCESPAAPAAGGVEIGSAATAARHSVSVATGGSARLALPELADGSACAVTESGPSAATLSAVEGGLTLTGPDGSVRGVAVTVVRGSTVTAHLTHTIPVAVESVPAPITADAASTTTTGSGSAATSSPLPASDGDASAAAPVALAAARSTAATSSTALPDTSGSTTTLVLASVGILLCGATGYALVLNSRRRGRMH